MMPRPDRLSLMPMGRARWTPPQLSSDHIHACVRAHTYTANKIKTLKGRKAAPSGTQESARWRKTAVGVRKALLWRRARTSYDTQQKLTLNVRVGRGGPSNQKALTIMTLGKINGTRL